MPFPLSAHGAIVAESLDTAEAKSVVEAMLRRAKATTVTIDGDRIAFTAGFFRLATSWNLLAPVDSGCVTFRQCEHGVEVRYRLSFTQMLLVVSAMVVLFFGIYPVVAIGPQARVPVPILLFAWFWLFGGNYVITRYRFPYALRSSFRARAASTNNA